MLHEKAKGQSNNQIGILLIKAPISLGRDLSIYYIPIMINKTCLKNFSRQKTILRHNLSDYGIIRDI